MQSRVSTGHSTEEGGAAQSQSWAAKPSTVRAEPLSTSGGAKCRVHHETWVLPPEQPPHGSETDLDQLPPLLSTHCTVQCRVRDHFGNSHCTLVLSFLLQLPEGGAAGPISPQCVLNHKGQTRGLLPLSSVFAPPPHSSAQVLSLPLTSFFILSPDPGPKQDKEPAQQGMIMHASNI